MKTLFTFIIALALFSASGGELVRWQNQWTTVYTNSLIATNSFVFTNGSVPVTITNIVYAPNATFHTFQFFYVASGSNSLAQNLESTIDQVNWVPELTNTVTAIGTTGYVAQTYAIQGKRVAFRLRTTYINTNGSIAALYEGQ